MGRPTYELPAPLRRVHKTTGNAAGERILPPDTALFHRPPDDTDGVSANKDGTPFVHTQSPFQKPFMQQIGEIWPRTTLLFYERAPYVTVSEIRFMVRASGGGRSKSMKIFL